MINATAKIRVALCGSPNSGKSSLFNGLTGSDQHVGNYPGVTVEKRVGRCRWADRILEVQDLPGTYSLSSWSPEETIAQRELVDEAPDVVVVVVDSTALKRSLVLLTQVMQNSDRIVLCLNMADEARKSGQKLDLDQLETLLGFPVIETVGHRQIGLDDLRDRIVQVSDSPVQKSRLMLGELLESAISEITDQLEQTAVPPRARDWYATRLLQSDPLFVSRVDAMGEPGRVAVILARDLARDIEVLMNEEIRLFVTQRYYGFVDGLLKEVLISAPHIDTRILSDRLDSVVVHRVLGIPIFLAVMYTVFWLTFSVGSYFMSWIEALFLYLSDGIVSLWPSSASSEMRSLLVDGIIGGVGGVLVFLPNIVLLFLGLAVLQDSGYMSRAAFLTDRVMHRFGLHGRSFIPMVTGFGCTIPGIMATRTMENERDRLTTMLVLPLMSCGARLPIWLLLIPSFFPAQQHALLLMSIYLIGILTAFILSLLLRNTLLRGEEAPFVMELPPYRLPTMRSVIHRVKMSAWLYLKKAGTIILAISVLMWILTTYPQYQETTTTPDGTEITEDDNDDRFRRMENSYAGRLGKSIEPVIAPLGFDWKIGIAIIGAFTAKEVFVAQMGVIYSLGESDGDHETLRSALNRDYSPLVGFSLMLFLLISTPCMATIAVTRKESGHWKWAALQFFGLTAVAWLLSMVVYQLGSIFA